MEYLRITIEAPAELEEQLTALLFLWGAEGVAVDDPSIIAAHLAAGDWDASVFDGQTIETGRVVLTTLAAATEEGQALAEQARSYCTGRADLAYLEEWQPEQNWQQKWRESFQPLPVGDRLEILPYWLAEQAQPDRLPILVSPGMAFGTGDHATTAMVLELLEQCLQPGDRVLDLGCGSGILAIAALRLGAGAVAGVDIDPVCVASVEEHLCRNGFTAEQFALTIGDILQDVTLQRDLAQTPWDKITANLTAGLLTELAPLLDPLLTRDGLLLCSGIIDEKAGQVEEALYKAGMRLVERRSQAGWQAFLCAKEAR